jgi:hypothetical protein
METIFATEGRPWPRALVFYVVYASGAVSFAMLHGLDEDGDPTFACDADIFSLSIIALLYLIVFRTNSACVATTAPAPAASRPGPRAAAPWPCLRRARELAVSAPHPSTPRAIPLSRSRHVRARPQQLRPLD